MNKKPKLPFKRWQFVRCIDDDKIWADDRNYSCSLYRNKIYIVEDHTNNYGNLRNGPVCIRVYGDSYWHKSSNFVKSNIFKWLLNKYFKKR